MSEPGAAISEGAARRPRGRASTAAFSYHGYRQAGLAPAVHSGLPSPFLTLIVTLDEPLTVARHVDGRAGGAYDTLAGGLHTAPALIAHDGAQSGIQVQVDPLACRPLFGMPAAALFSHDGNAADVLGRRASELQQRVQQAPSWPERFDILDEVLGRVLAAGIGESRCRAAGGAMARELVADAWRRICASQGAVGVHQLAEDLGYSARYLEKCFQRELGLPPKTAIRIARFDAARRALQRGYARDTTVGEIAARFGHFDQPHFVREFTAFAGMPPTAWLAQEFANVQAEPAEVGAG